jgi:hypothetical protein
MSATDNLQLTLFARVSDLLDPAQYSSEDTSLSQNKDRETLRRRRISRTGRNSENDVLRSPTGDELTMRESLETHGLKEPIELHVDKTTGETGVWGGLHRLQTLDDMAKSEDKPSPFVPVTWRETRS